ncbi:MAG: triose-phosphate isomerase [bacterium]
MKPKKILVIANWKMTPNTLVEAKAKMAVIKRGVDKLKMTETIICPPFPFIATLSQMAGGPKGKIKIGAQDISKFESGAHTGEISAVMLKSAGVSHIIVGHSERRAIGEDTSLIAQKLQKVLAAGMIGIVCVGEAERDNDAEYLTVIKNQLKEVLIYTSRQQFANLVIAYEPLWAVNNSQNIAITAHEIHQIVILIRKYLKDNWGESIASIVKIVYGGSVTPDNAQDLVHNGDVDGLLVGRAGWQPEGLKSICQSLNIEKKKPKIKLKKKK